jgi:cytochrome P450
MPAGEPFNFVEGFSVPLPLLVICLILGVPYEDADFIRYFSDEFAHLVDPVFSTERAAKAADTVADGYLYFERYVNKFRAQPADNLLSEIANATIHGRPISIEEALSMAHNLVIAGNETTPAERAGANP